MSVRIVVAQGEPIGSALKHLQQSMYRASMPKEIRRRRYFMSASQTRRTKRFRKRCKAQHATLLAQLSGEQPVGSSASSAAARVKFWKRTGKR